MSDEAKLARRRAFGDALRDECEREGVTQQELASRLALVGFNVTYQAVGAWQRGENEPEREAVFALDEIFGRPAGTFSRLLGYLPAEATASGSVLEAIDADLALSSGARRVLRGTYLAALEG